MEAEKLYEISLKADSNIKQIPLSEIDPNVIHLVRDLNTESQSYLQLKKSIEKDGQQQPIIIRELTDQEKQKQELPTQYGIIDGHHRFNIAKELSYETISVIIDTGEASPARDMILSMRFNESSLKMSVIQKGEVIYKVLETLYATSNKKLIEEIGEKIFGLKPAMTYRCLRAYKIAMKKETISKPRQTSFDIKQIESGLQKLPENLENISAIDEQNLKQYQEAIKSIETQLRILKKELDKVKQEKASNDKNT